LAIIHSYGSGRMIVNPLSVDGNPNDRNRVGKGRYRHRSMLKARSNRPT
jgi:hypothetical protein